MKTDCGEAHIARSTRMAVPPVGHEPAGVEFRSSDLIARASLHLSTVRPAHLLELQPRLGNRAVAQLVASPASHVGVFRVAHKPPVRPKPKRAASPMRRPAVRAFLQRAVACPPAPVAPQPVAPAEDPWFTKVTGEVNDVAGKEKRHTPVKTEVADTQGAAAGPPNEAAAQAGAAQVDKMGAANADFGVSVQSVHPFRGFRTPRRSESLSSTGVS